MSKINILTWVKRDNCLAFFCNWLYKNLAQLFICLFFSHWKIVAYPVFLKIVPGKLIVITFFKKVWSLWFNPGRLYMPQVWPAVQRLMWCPLCSILEIFYYPCCYIWQQMAVRFGAIFFDFPVTRSLKSETLN